MAEDTMATRKLRRRRAREREREREREGELRGKRGECQSGAFKRLERLYFVALTFVVQAVSTRHDSRLALRVVRAVRTICCMALDLIW